MVEEKQENPLHAKEEGRAEGSSEETTGNGRSLGVFSFEGDIPLTQAVPLGLQHVLAMFVGNLTPLLIVTGDHTHSISVAGTVDDNKPGKDMREKVGVYADAGYPNYEDKDKDGFPDNFQPSKRLAVFFGAHPDYYETYRSYPDATFNPAVKNEKGEYVADARYKDVEGGHFVEGNLPRNESQGVHTVDDLVVTAQGPNAEQIRGFMNSTEVFRVMAEALALGK